MISEIHNYDTMVSGARRQRTLPDAHRQFSAVEWFHI